MSNPYSGILELLQYKGNNGNKGSASSPGQSIRLAKVIEAEVDEDKLTKLTIEVGDLQLSMETNNIYMANHLTKGYTRTVGTNNTAELEGVTTSVNDGGQGASSHLHELVNLEVRDMVVTTQDTLEVGDILAVLATADKQTYIIMEKVEKL